MEKQKDRQNQINQSSIIESTYISNTDSPMQLVPNSKYSDINEDYNFNQDYKFNNFERESQNKRYSDYSKTRNFIKNLQQDSFDNSQIELRARAFSNKYQIRNKIQIQSEKCQLSNESKKKIDSNQQIQIIQEGNIDQNTNINEQKQICIQKYILLLKELQQKQQEMDEIIQYNQKNCFQEVKIPEKNEDFLKKYKAIKFVEKIYYFTYTMTIIAYIIILVNIYGDLRNKIIYFPSLVFSGYLMIIGISLQIFTVFIIAFFVRILDHDSNNTYTISNYKISQKIMFWIVFICFQIISVIVVIIFAFISLPIYLQDFKKREFLAQNSIIKDQINNHFKSFLVFIIYKVSFEGGCIFCAYKIIKSSLDLYNRILTDKEEYDKMILIFDQMQIWLKKNQMINLNIEESQDEISSHDVKIFIQNNKFIYKKLNANSKNDECSICYQYFNHGKDQVVNLRCGKVFFQKKHLSLYRKNISLKADRILKLIVNLQNVNISDQNMDLIQKNYQLQEEALLKKQTVEANHIFHYDCILKWLQIQKVCPLCKLTVGYQLD